MITRLGLWLLLIPLYIALLTINLLQLPLYLDEGIFIHYSYLFSIDPSYAYVSMQEGKTPLFFWLVTLINNSIGGFLLSARLLSVIASTVTLICFLTIASILFNKKVRIILFILFLITPFNILYSRMAFVDSLMVSFGSLSILMFVLFQQTPLKKNIFYSLLLAVLSGFFLSFSFMTKTPGKIFLISQITLLALLVIECLKHRNFRLLFTVILFTLVTLGTYAEINSYLKIGSYRFWGMISEKENSLAFSLPEILHNLLIKPNSIYLKNLQIIFGYFNYYFSTLTILFILGVVWIIKNKKHVWILILIAVLFAGLFLSSKLPASRYFIVIVPEFLLICSIGFLWIWENKSKYLRIFAICLLIIPAFFSFKMLIASPQAYYHPDDRAGFVDYNLNALGLIESIKILEPYKDNSIVGVTGIWGVSEGALVSFKEKGFEVYPLNNVVVSHPKKDFCENNFKELDNQCFKVDFGKLMESRKDKYVYLITEVIGIESLKKIAKIELVKEFKRPKTNLNVYLLKINP